jgi:hypothetical protein
MSDSRIREPKGGILDKRKFIDDMKGKDRTT